MVMDDYVDLGTQLVDLHMQADRRRCVSLAAERLAFFVRGNDIAGMPLAPRQLPRIGQYRTVGR